MRKILDGEWGELQWIVHLRYENEKIKKERKGTVALLDHEVIWIFRGSYL